jgi:2-phosphosulfolactate phosphatase
MRSSTRLPHDPAPHQEPAAIVIDVALTRAELRPADVAVVVDVLRATSTATQALVAGYRTVLCAESMELAENLRAPGRVLAGERSCVMPPGFDMGNSPIEHQRRYGDELVLTTTNGAPTIVAATRRADLVLLACLLNLESVVRVLREANDHPDHTIQIVCCGTDGAAALEDVYVAGRLCAQLDGARTDAAQIAEAVARAYRTPLEALAASTDAVRLVAAGLAEDIAYCARESELDVVPRVLATTRGTAIVVAGDAAGARTTTAAIDRMDIVSTMDAGPYCSGSG